MTKKQQQQQKQKKKPLTGANVPTSCTSFSLSQNSHRTRQANSGDKGCAEACAERFSNSGCFESKVIDEKATTTTTKTKTKNP